MIRSIMWFVIGIGALAFVFVMMLLDLLFVEWQRKYFKEYG